MALWRGLPAYHPDTASSTESCLFSVREGGGLIIYNSITHSMHQDCIQAPRGVGETTRVSLQRKFPVAREGGRERWRYRFRSGTRSRQHRPSVGKDAQSNKEGKERRGPSSFAVLALLPRYVFIHCRRPFCFRIAVYDLGRSNQGSATCCRRRRHRVLESGSRCSSSSNVR